ncbi:hypothetical protein Tco_0906791 [Tanacetum coccineum]|uniref:Uncharacterized protein n=1 Tax=Tanacetum coccineum TaxID=301880 RepID=A0ABQ5CHF5_9ASTR
MGDHISGKNEQTKLGSTQFWVLNCVARMVWLKERSDGTVGLNRLGVTKIVLLGLESVPLTSRFIGCVQQDELPSSVELDFQARLDGGRDTSKLPQDSLAFGSRSLPLADWSNVHLVTGLKHGHKNFRLRSKVDAIMRGISSGKSLKRVHASDKDSP